MLSFPAVKTKIDQDHTIQPSQKIMLEWNYNIHAGVSELGIDDVPLYQFNETEGDLKLIETSTVHNKYYESLYPLTSIVNFIRPGEYAINNPGSGKVGGIIKGVFNTNSCFTNYDHKAATRNYFVSKDDGYKYWAFLRKSQSGSSVNKSVYVKYDRVIKTNKLVVKFETGHTVPTNYTVYVRQSNTWVQAYTSSTSLTNGGLTLYYNGTAWTTTKHTAPSVTANTQNIDGIKVLVSTVNVGYSPLEIIEVSARLEAELTTDVLTWSIEKTYFEEHEVLPIGFISSNSANISFDNTSNIFSYENSSAKYYGLLDKRIAVRIYTIIDSTEIPQYTGFIDTWNIEANNTASVTCYDMAKVLQQTAAPDMVIGENFPISKVIRVMFDAIGLNEITIDYTGTASDNVDLFWMSQEQTFWDVLAELCISHQCVVFVDEYGKFVFKSRATALDSQTTEVLLTYNKSGNVLPNIVDVRQSTRPRIGNLTIKYSRRSYENQNDIITTYKAFSRNPRATPASFRGSTYATSVWDPGKAWTLGAAALVHPISENETSQIIVEQPDMVPVVQKNQEPVLVQTTGLTQFSGYFYLNGEIIYYGSTQFRVSYKDGRPIEYVNISSTEEFLSLVNSDPAINEVFNTCVLKEIKRGQFATTAKAHNPVSTDNGDWSKYQFKIGEQTKDTLPAPSFSVNQRSLTLSTDNQSGVSKISSLKPEERRKYVQLGLVNLKKDNYKRFECTMRIVQKQPTEKVGDVDSIGGIFFDYNTSNNAGYFIELGLENTTNSFKKANANKSLAIYKVKANGDRVYLAAVDNLTGRAKRDSEDTIFKDVVSFNTVQNYDVQVLRITRNGKRCIDVYIMGQLIVQVEDTDPLPLTNKAGVFVRGDSTAYFTKFAAWGANGESTLQDGSFFADSIRGFITEVVAAGNLGVPSKMSLETDYDYYEFYPYMREIRVVEFDYNKAPASPLKISAGPNISSYGATLLDSNSFRAKIAVINESNFPVNLSSTFPGEVAAPYPKLLGFALKKYEPKEYKITISKARSDDAKFEIDSQWIQSYSQAKSIADFIKLNSSTLRDGKTNDVIRLEVDITPNPLLQLGDTVDIEYPDLGLSSVTHSFIIVGISQQFDGGISTRLILQEVA